MHELVETVLTVGTWLSKDDRTCFDALSISDSSHIDTLAIAFHVDLLDVSSKSMQSLAVRKDCSGSMATNVSVVESQKAHQDWDVFRHVISFNCNFIHSIHAVEELANIVKSVVKRKRKNTDSRADGIATSDPIPEAKDILI